MSASLNDRPNKVEVAGDAATVIVGGAGTQGEPGVGVPAGGASGEVLAKASTSDYDTEWVAQSGGISPTIIDAKGDLIVGSAADTAARLAVGTDGYVLTADSGQTGGIKWAASAPVFAPAISGRYYSGVPSEAGVVASTASGLANRFTCFRFFVPSTTTYTSATIFVLTAAASSNARFGIYTDNAGAPASLIIDYGAVSTATTGAKEVVSSVTLGRGMYWAAVHCDLAGTNFRTVSLGDTFSEGRSAASSANSDIGRQAIVTYGPLPSTAPSTSIGYTAPMILLKAA